MVHFQRHSVRDESDACYVVLLTRGRVLVCFALRSFIEAMSERGREQRYLFAYPIGLLYSCFALLTVF